MEILKNRNVLLVSISFFFIFFGFGASQQFIIPIFGTFGGENIAITSLVILYGMFLVGSFFAPKIISILGSKKSFLIPTLVYISFILSISLKNEYILYSLSAVLGLFASVLWVNVSSYIINVTNKKLRGEGLGLQMSLFIMGNLLGISSTTLMLDFLSVSDVFVVLSSVSLFGLFPFFWIKNRQTRIKSRSPTDIFGTFRNLKVVLLIPVIFFTFFLWSQILSAINLVIESSLGIFYVGVAGIIFNLIFLFSAYFFGKLTRSFKKNYILIITLSIALIGISMFLTQSNLIITMLSVAFMSLHISTVFPVALNLMKDVTKKDSETVAGSFSILNSGGVMTSFITVFFLKEILSLEIALFIGIIGLISIILLSRKL